MSQEPSTDFRRAEETRLAAQRSMFRRASKSRTQSADRARPRNQPQPELGEADAVYVWRKNLEPHVRGWIGPEVVITINASRSSVLVAI